MSALKNMPISFPGLFGDWELNIDPVAIHIGHGIYWYGIILAFAMLAGLYLCMKQAKHYGLTEDNIMDMVLWAVPIGVICARAYYCIFYWELYADNPISILYIWEGGLAIYGGVIGGAITILVVSRVKKIKTGTMLDIAAMAVLIGQIFGRWGNFMNREAFGAATELPWRMRLWTSATTYMDVHPTFLYESLWNVIGLLLLYFVVSRARRFDGENTCFYFLWYGIGRFWIEGLRTDSLYLFHVTLFGERVRVSQALSLVMIVLTAVILLKNRSADPARMFVNRRLDGQATVLPDRSEERPIEDGPAEDAAGGEASAEGAAEPADGGDNG